MRGVLFEENYIEDLYDFLDIKKDDGKEYENEKPNPLLSSDIIQLQKHHMVLLEYTKHLEETNNSMRDKIEYLERMVKYYEEKEKEQERLSGICKM